ncbi:MAG: hypothetical protein R6U31_01180 [bacterium]
MKSIAAYLLYFFGFKLGVIRHPHHSVNTYLSNKNTLKKLAGLLFKYPYRTFYNALHYSKSIYQYNPGRRAPFENSLIYRLKHKLPLKILITPSYCEKPLDCPVRFTDYCERDNCDIECKFRDYPRFGSKDVNYYFLTDDESIADRLIEAFHFNRKTGGRVLFVMSICSFSADFTKLFGIFGAWILIHPFTCRNACSNIIQYFTGDSGLNLNITGSDTGHIGMYVNSLNYIKKITE